MPDTTDEWYFGDTIMTADPQPTPQLAIAAAMRTGRAVQCTADSRFYMDDGTSMAADPEGD